MIYYCGWDVLLWPMYAWAIIFIVSNGVDIIPSFSCHAHKLPAALTVDLQIKVLQKLLDILQVFKSPITELKVFPNRPIHWGIYLNLISVCRIELTSYDRIISYSLPRPEIKIEPRNPSIFDLFSTKMTVSAFVWIPFILQAGITFSSDTSNYF